MENFLKTRTPREIRLLYLMAVVVGFFVAFKLVSPLYSARLQAQKELNEQLKNELKLYDPLVLERKIREIEFETMKKEREERELNRKNELLKRKFARLERKSREVQKLPLKFVSQICTKYGVMMQSFAAVSPDLSPPNGEAFDVALSGEFMDILSVLNELENPVFLTLIEHLVLTQNEAKFRFKFVINLRETPEN